ncbi:transposase [Paenibacillus stellifer]|uniref:Transposase n=1 Tax=Paenibacillus stellifer TaxID=169760 RepID=A0A089N956_9BACL|nr:transposase [Paenibacillus stellifer]AIQ62783.1 transposase [Paenibacillus stellifer]AIQ62901.1 transposase [Paenibacillus stellifer]AIQ63007.1 transposase [Paenibacillus stellifer]AIQ65043.1 transposase [Paenibacillus stellifer]AIQ65334.1 transposase [Paenibacillus stellifer]
MYILQESLFSFEELQKIESKERLPIFFSALDLRPYARELRNPSPRGADGHCRQGILRALLAAPLENIDTFTGLARRLKFDLRFRYQCGLRLDIPAPSISTLSRVFAELTGKGLAKQLFEDLVTQCQEAGIIDGTHVAIDSAAIHAYEKKEPKRKSELTGNANWGAKFDTFGNKVKWFGYKLHLAVDAKSELPMALKVTSAHVNDGDEGPALMTTVAAKSKVKFFMLDAGYDQIKNYEAARNVKAQAIIPLNPRNEKEPPAGITRKGTPCCSMGFPMTYWGQEKVHLKFRCPHATGQVDCPLGMAACSSSNYGMVVKINSQTDLRRYALPHRESRGWKELYNKRTSVERCNSRMKTYLTADQLHVWGIQKVTTHQYLNAIVLLASALAIAKQRVQNAA